MRHLVTMAFLLLLAVTVAAGDSDLSHPDPNVRLKALVAIGKSGTATDTTVALVAEALEDEEPRVRARALVTLSSLGEAGVPHVEPRLAAAGTRAEARKAIETAGKRAVPLLIALSSSGNWRVRKIACEHLGACGAGRNTVAGRLVDPAAAVRLAAVDAIAKIGGDGIVTILAPALADQNDVIRGRALSCIAEFDEESEARTAILIREARAEDWGHRWVALAGLGTAAPEGVLEKALTDDRDEIRVEAAMRLVERGKRDAKIADVLLGRLPEMIVSSDVWPYRRRSHRNLRAEGGRRVTGLRLPPRPKTSEVAQALVDLAPHSVPGLVEHLRSSDNATRWNAIVLLDRIGGEHRKHLVPVLRGQREPDRVMAAVLLAPYPEHREAVAAILVPVHIENRIRDEGIEDPVIRGDGPWEVGEKAVAKATKHLGKAVMQYLEAQLEALGPKPEMREGEVYVWTAEDYRRVALKKLIEEYRK